MICGQSLQDLNRKMIASEIFTSICHISSNPLHLPTSQEKLPNNFFTDTIVNNGKKKTSEENKIPYQETMGFLMKYDQPQKSYRDRERTQNALILSVTSSCRRRGVVLLIHYFKITVKTSDFLTPLAGTNNRNNNQNND